MLKSMRLRNLRAFADTGEIKFSNLNIFIGPNNAGKTTFVSSIELLLKSLGPNPSGSPLNLSEIASFASFDAAVRRHWSRNEKRPTQIKINYELGDDAANPVRLEFVCEADAGSNASYVSRATYWNNKQRAVLSSMKNSSGARRFRGQLNDRKYSVGSVFFIGIWPIFQQGKGGAAGNFSAQVFGGAGYLNRRNALEVVKPFRPAPRSYYVLDDPHIEHEERELVTYLANLWDRNDDGSKLLRSRIISGLKALGLTTEIDVKRTTQKRGPTILEIRVAPHSVRQKVTIADAGFGLSQVLPLVVSDARLSNGCLIAYQPEVHLHPYAQSRLADLFADSVNRKNQVFVESHSPDLIMRLQVLILSKKLKPEDVAVFCFENKNGKPGIRRVDFDEIAKPSVPWPAGFLDTSLGLAREINEIRVKGGAVK